MDLYIEFDRNIELSALVNTAAGDGWYGSI
jgi:hypothetical protein